jgi:hypothetical protein
MGLFSQPFKLGFKGKLYENLADPGSMLFGGAGVSNSLGQKRDEKSTGMDWFGSPVTAGTDSQGMARLGALLYGGYAGAGAMGAGGMFGGSGSTGAAAGGPSSGLGGLFGSSATGGGGSTAPAWMNYARLGNMAMNMGGGGGGGQGQGQPPLQHQFVGQTPQNPYLGLYNT